MNAPLSPTSVGFGLVTRLALRLAPVIVLTIAQLAGPFAPGRMAGNAAVTLAAPAAPEALHGIITVNEFNQEVTNDSGCSLQEAIFAANFDTNAAVDPANPNGGYINTGCTAGSGTDTIILPAGLYQMSGSIVDPDNYLGLTATPMITSTIILVGNGPRSVTLERSTFVPSPSTPTAT